MMDSRQPDIPDDVLDRYLAGDASPEERRSVKRALRANPDSSRVIAALRTIGFRVPNDRIRALDELRVRTLVTERLGAFPGVVGTEVLRWKEHSLWGKRSGRTQTLPRGEGSLRRRIGVAFAASAMVCVIVAGWLSWQNSIPHLVQRYHTEAGQRSVVHLADGSVLTLAPSTSVRVSPTSITVSGEVSFVVAHRSTRPFEVRTSTATVQLLGTVFGVRQYPDERHTRVVVDEGKLSVRTRHHDASLGEPRVISARMLAIVTDSDVTVTSGMTMSNNAGVVSGTLVFNQSKLSDMVLTLSRAYGIDIQIADTTLASQTLSMDVAVTEESPNQVLNSICNVTDAHYVRRGETYVITPGRRDAHRPPSGPRYYLFPQSESQYGR